MFSSVPASTAPEKTAQTYGRIKEMLGTDAVPAAFETLGAVEPFLKDAYMNFKRFVWTTGALDEKTKAAIAFAVAVHGKSKVWSEFLAGRCRAVGFNDQQLAEIAAVTATNAMYNTFFKFRDLSGSSLFEGMGVGLRAHTFGGTSLDEKTIELINTAISNLNACRPCTSGHVTAARGLGLTDDQLLETIQCAATVYAVVQFSAMVG